VSLPFPLLTSHPTLDIERVEVLKGPQGTLFGENSTGGAINFIAAKPTAAFATGWDLTYGRFNRTEIDGFVSGAVASDLNMRLAVSEDTGSDWQYSYTRDSYLGAMHVFNGRLIADWKPLDALRFEFNVNGWVDKSDPQAAQFYKLDLQIPGAAPAALVNYPIAPQNDRAADWAPDGPHGDQTLFQTSVRTEYDVSAAATITSLSSYVHGTRHDVLDPDGMAIDGYEYLPVGSINALSEELRIANSSAERLRYTFGGLFEHQQVLDNGILTYADSSLAHAYGFSDNGLVSNQIMTNAAGFGNLDFDLADTNTLKVGARFTQSNRSDLGCAYDPRRWPYCCIFHVSFVSGSGHADPADPARSMHELEHRVPAERVLRKTRSEQRVVAHWR
jgi:outer membrane receptor protein involved in Fe transport